MFAKVSYTCQRETDGSSSVLTNSLNEIIISKQNILHASRGVIRKTNYKKDIKKKILII